MTVSLDIQERYVGQKTAQNTVPNPTDLTAFVVSTTSPSRNPNIGDIVTWVDVIPSATDTIYKCTYYSTGWAWYVIPDTESASDTNLGLIQGDMSGSNNIRYTITAGKITDVLVNKSGTYVSISSMLVPSDLNVVYGISGSVTLATSDWSNKVCTKTISGLGSNDAIFFTPSSSSDKTALQNADVFVSVSGTTVTFTATTLPVADISLSYFISRGTN